MFERVEDFEGFAGRAEEALVDGSVAGDVDAAELTLKVAFHCFVPWDSY